MSTTPKKLKLDRSSQLKQSDQQKSQSTPNSSSVKTRVIQSASKSSQNISPAPKSSFMFEQIQDYTVLKTLGEGNFAKVKLARHEPTKTEVAIKIIDKTKVPAKSFPKLYREIKAMSRLNHPNIIKLYQVIEDTNKLYLVVEYAQCGEVFDYIRVNSKMSEKEARSKFRQILSAVQYCHQKQIVHRDLKTENLLLDKKMNIKLGDFGFCNKFHLDSKLETFCGSPPFAAPELFRGCPYIGPEVDVWSLGVLLYVMVSGTLPFDGNNLTELKDRILAGKYRVPFFMSMECEALLKKLLVLDSTKRYTIDSIFQDKWVNMGYEMEKLKPYVEPVVFSYGKKQIDYLLTLGYTQKDILDALGAQKYNDKIFATYLLLGGRPKTTKHSPIYQNIKGLRSAPNPEEKKMNTSPKIEKVKATLKALPDTKIETPPKVSSRISFTPVSRHSIRDSNKILSEKKEANKKTEPFARKSVARATFHAGQPLAGKIDTQSIKSNNSEDGDKGFLQRLTTRFSKRFNLFSPKRDNQK